MSGALVQTQYGKVQGVQEGMVYSSKGLSYAKPPLGALRFHPPQPPEAESSTPGDAIWANGNPATYDA